MNPTVAPVHSRDPSCLSFLSHDSLYSSHSHDSRGRARATDGSLTRGSGLGIVGELSVNKDLVEVPTEEVLITPTSKKNEEVLIASTSNNVNINNDTTSNNNTTNSRKSNNLNTTNNNNNVRRDGNTVTIVQTTDSSQVIGSESVIVTVSGNETEHNINSAYRSPTQCGTFLLQSRQFDNNRIQESVQTINTDREISVLAHL